MIKLTEDQIKAIDKIMRDGTPRSISTLNRIANLGRLFSLHFKNNVYIISSVSKHTETGEVFMNYRRVAEVDTYFSRPYDMFISEVDKEKYPDCEHTYRMRIADCVQPEPIKLQKIVEIIEEYFKGENNNETV